MATTPAAKKRDKIAIIGTLLTLSGAVLLGYAITWYAPVAVAFMIIGFDMKVNNYANH